MQTIFVAKSGSGEG